MYKFANPEFFLLFLIFPLLLFYYLYKYKNNFSEFKLSSLSAFSSSQRSIRVFFKKFLPFIRFVALSLFIIALARPQTILEKEKHHSEGIDIVIALDISESMLARDFNPNRLEAAKSITKDFINKRPEDRIGLVLFSGESFTKCPITTDHDILKQMLKDSISGIMESGTAIGLGIATSVDRLKTSKVKSKIIILLTDGVNNSGFIDPLTAANIAKNHKIRIYTIGVGTNGKASMPIGVYPNGQYAYDMVDVEIDENTLTQIAEMTGTKYFRATNEKKLKEIYQEIDKMEKSKIEVTSTKRHKDYFFKFVFWGIILIVLETMLKYSILKSFP